MRTIIFMPDREPPSRRIPGCDVLHIETTGGIVNIRTGLHDDQARAVVHVELLANPEAVLDGSVNNRFIQPAEEGA